MELKDKVTQLKGVGPKKAQALEKLNIRTLEDMVFFLPRDYEDRRNRLRIGQLAEDMTGAVEARVTMIVPDGDRRVGKQLLRLLVSDDTGSM